MGPWRCPVCDLLMSPRAEEWRWVCDACGYEASTFQQTINTSLSQAMIDEGAREAGLKQVRQHNFEVLVDVLRKSVRPQGRVLDVGAAHGWFLETAGRSFDVFGIEPDEAVYNATTARGIRLRKGFFPDVMAAGEKVDAIVFNDVIEHVAPIGEVLDACWRHLADDGVLLINLPSTKGIFYRSALLLSRLGMRSFLERLWQKDLASPHVHYFQTKNLESLLRHHRFEPIVRGRLETLRFSGLWMRISYTGDHMLAARIVLFAAIALALPFLAFAPSDIVYVAARPVRSP